VLTVDSVVVVEIVDELLVVVLELVVVVPAATYQPHKAPLITQGSAAAASSLHITPLITLMQCSTQGQLIHNNLIHISLNIH